MLTLAQYQIERKGNPHARNPDGGPRYCRNPDHRAEGRASVTHERTTRPWTVSLAPRISVMMKRFAPENPFFFAFIVPA